MQQLQTTILRANHFSKPGHNAVLRDRGSYFFHFNLLQEEKKLRFNKGNPPELHKGNQ